MTTKRPRDYYLGKEDKTVSPNSTNEESNSKKKKTDVWNGNTDSPAIEVYKNHIYFYSGVTKKTCLKLNYELRRQESNIISTGRNIINKDKYIYLHINSFGGSVFAALSVIDTILNLQIPVVSIIEGAAASAATLISIVCNYRIIYKNSFMLIHQLSSSTWGKMDELEDEMKNLKQLMKKIKDLYKKYTDINEDDLDIILKHDLWWNSTKCLDVKLVDEIYKNKKLYSFDKNNIKI